MKPTCIEDIVALVALYRPGPMENIPTYCEVKHGLRPLESIHPTIDHILSETQGIIVYQEQVMQIAQVMGGYSLGGADLLRRAMGKKIAEEMAKERPKFIEGCKATHNIDAKKSGEVFDLLEKFANYGFNKSHAAAYAVVSYQTGWLKANHPVEFMSGVMNCDIHLTDKLAVYKRELDKMGIKVVAPCVNASAATFTVKDQALVYALGALKNVGVDAMGLIVAARKTETGAEKPFATLFDFARRVDLKRVGKRPLEMLARAGAFDQLEPNRARVFEALDSLVAYSAAIHEAKASNQVSLFGDSGSDIPEPRLPFRDDWLPVERLGHEHQAVGFYLSGHPLDDYMSALKRKDVKTLAEITARAANGPFVGKLAGSVASKQERKSAKGNRFAFVQLSDPTGLYEVTVFSDVLEQARDYLEPGKNVVLTVKVDPDGDGPLPTQRSRQSQSCIGKRYDISCPGGTGCALSPSMANVTGSTRGSGSAWRERMTTLTYSGRSTSTSSPARARDMRWRLRSVSSFDAHVSECMTPAVPLEMQRCGTTLTRIIAGAPATK
jgi:DNA polymerase-3 subunit alpha